MDSDLVILAKEISEASRLRSERCGPAAPRTVPEFEVEGIVRFLRGGEHGMHKVGRLNRNQLAALYVGIAALYHGGKRVRQRESLAEMLSPAAPGYWRAPDIARMFHVAHKSGLSVIPLEKLLDALVNFGMSLKSDATHSLGETIIRSINSTGVTIYPTSSRRAEGTAAEVPAEALEALGIVVDGVAGDSGTIVSASIDGSW